MKRWGRTGAKSKTRTSGFTLLEILMAIIIFSVIATIVYSAMNAAISRVNVIRDGGEVFDMAAGCLYRISTDLQAVYADPYPLFSPPDYDDPPDPYVFSGEIDYVGGDSFSRLQFASCEHLPVSGGKIAHTRAAPGLTQVRYYVQESENQDWGYVLKRGDHPFPYDMDPDEPDPETDPVLCTHIEEFKFTFYDHEGEPFDAWDSSDEGVRYATPRAVEVSLTIATRQGEYPFSTRVFLPVCREALKRVEE